MGLGDEERECAPRFQPFVGGRVGNHGRNIQLVSAMVRGIGEDVVLLARRFGALAVHRRQLLPADPRRVSDNHVEFPSGGGPEKVTDEPEPDTIPVAAM